MKINEKVFKQELILYVSCFSFIPITSLGDELNESENRISIDRFLASYFTY